MIAPVAAPTAMYQGLKPALTESSDAEISASSPGSGMPMLSPPMISSTTAAIATGGSVDSQSTRSCTTADATRSARSTLRDHHIVDGGLDQAGGGRVGRVDQ